MKHVTADNYQDMYIRISAMENNDTVVGSSNFDRLLEYLLADNDSWIKEINEKLEE